MHRFFVPAQQIKKPHIFIEGEDVKHIRKVLRLSDGDQVVVSDGRGTDFVVRIDSVSGERVATTILREEGIKEFLPHVSLLQGFAKGAKMDLIVRQATELGVSEIVPIFTERTVVKWESGEHQGRILRWAKIAEEASKQSQRSYLPKILSPKNWQEALQMVSSCDLALVPWEEEKGQGLRSVLRNCSGKWERVALVIGPEGGLTEEEVSQLKEWGALSVSIGKNILRTETAAVAALAMIFYELDEG